MGGDRGWADFLHECALDEAHEAEENERLFGERECPGDVCCGDNTISGGEEYCDSCTFYHKHGHERGEGCSSPGKCPRCDT